MFDSGDAAAVVVGDVTVIATDVAASARLDH